MCRRAELDSYLPWFTDQGNRLEGPMSSREMCVIMLVPIWGLGGKERTHEAILVR